MLSQATLRVLLIGKGAREHALAWKLSQSRLVEHVYVVPGNGGTAKGLSGVSNVDNIEVDQYDLQVDLAKRLNIHLVVVGPDSAVVDGVEGYFRKGRFPFYQIASLSVLTFPTTVDIPCFAPTKEAAAIEGSKAFAKDFMQQYGIPTAEYRTFRDFQEAEAYIMSISHQVVIKADGLAAGKGVIIPEKKEEAIQALTDIMINDKFGAAGSAVVIEEYLEGQEISVSTFSDGHTILSLPVGQDHKRILDGDKGPNTGGMGVYAPVPAVTPTMMEKINQEILRPTFDGLRQQGKSEGILAKLYSFAEILKQADLLLDFCSRESC